MTATENPEVSQGEEAVEEHVVDVADEGDVAADYLEELLDIADLDGDIDIEVRGAVPTFPWSLTNRVLIWPG